MTRLVTRLPLGKITGWLSLSWRFACLRRSLTHRTPSLSTSGSNLSIEQCNFRKDSCPFVPLLTS